MALGFDLLQWQSCSCEGTVPGTSFGLSTTTLTPQESMGACDSFNKGFKILSLSSHSLSFKSSVQFSRCCVWLFATPWIAAHQAYLSITNSRSSLKLTSIKLVMPSSHLILCCPLLLLPPISSGIRVLSNESTLRMRWPKYWSFSFSIIPSKEIPGLISFRMDWLDLLAVQGTLKSLLQHHSSKASILQRLAFFTVQLSYPYMTTGKTIAILVVCNYLTKRGQYKWYYRSLRARSGKNKTKYAVYTCFPWDACSGRNLLPCKKSK